MKTKTHLLTLIALTFISCLSVSCHKSPTAEPDGTSEDSPSADPVQLNSEAKMASFTLLLANGKEKKAFLYPDEGVFEVSYFEEELPLLRNATAMAEISDGAKIEPDPLKSRDFTSAVEFTVTSEDGLTSTRWKVECVLAETFTYAEEVWVKSFGTLKEGKLKPSSMISNQIAFCDTDKFAYADRSVFDLDGNYLGGLNLPEAYSQWIVSMSNDSKGRLVCTVGHSRSGAGTAPQVDPLSDIGDSGDDVTGVQILMWYDGWDKEPVLLWQPFGDDAGANVGRYMSCGGDADGEFIINVICPARMDSDNNHHTFFWTSGIFDVDGRLNSPSWQWFNVAEPANDGCFAQEVISVDGHLDGTFIIGDSVPGGWSTFVRNPDGNDITLYGTSELGPFGYGHYTIGNCAAFVCFGREYVVTASAGWFDGLATIQTTDPTDDDHYLLSTIAYNGLNAPHPSAACVYDNDTETGHVLFCYCPAYSIVRYDIVRESI